MVCTKRAASGVLLIVVFNSHRPGLGFVPETALFLLHHAKYDTTCQ